MSSEVPVVAEVVRSGVVESVHRGSVVGLDVNGDAVVEVGDVDTQVFARSSLKPLQALALLRAGWQPGSDEETVAELTGDEVQHTAVDGCGAALFSCRLRGLARAFSRIASARDGTTEATVASAMRRHPWLVGGTGRDVTTLMSAVAGLIAKD